MTYPEITTVSIDDARYPKLLKQISDPPDQLYCRGNTALLNTECIGVVGTRRITPYGKEAAAHFTLTLANYFTIVSGLAYGIDAAIHKNTLDCGGMTIAVFGTGVDDDSISPRANLGLAQSILKAGGLLVSEYPPGTMGADWTFPRRNRIISGLSRGVVVVEADRQSGALITAKCALDQNRDVFAVPGSIFSPRSAGTNMLIQQGAKLVLDPQDILQEYNQFFESGNITKPRLSTENPAAEKILAILETDGPTHIDKLIALSELDASQIMAAVSMLEIRDMIKPIGNGTYKLN